MKITAAVTESAARAVRAAGARPGRPAPGRGARPRGRGRHLPHRPDHARPVVPGAPAGRARPRGRGHRGARRLRRDPGCSGRARGHELRLVRRLPDLPHGQAVLLPRLLGVQLRIVAPGRHERALAQRRAHPRALLRAVELRHVRRGQRTQHRHAPRLDPAGGRGALRLRHPDRRRRRARRPERSRRQHTGRLRNRCRRALGDHGRRDRGLHDDHRHRSQPGTPGAGPRARRDPPRRHRRARGGRRDPAHHRLRRRLQRRDDRRAGTPAAGSRLPRPAWAPAA